MSAPNVRRLDASPATEIAPSVISSWVAGTLSLAAPISSSASRASAAARRACAAARCSRCQRCGLIDGQLAVALDPRDALEGHIELLGHYLSEGGGHSGAQLDFAGVDGHAVVAADHEPRVECVGRRREVPGVAGA
jgi:hypothetical protein